MIRKANLSLQEFSNIDLCMCNVRYLPFRENFIDLIISVAVLEYPTEDIDFESVINEIARVLKIGGAVIIIETITNQLCMSM